MKTNATAKPLFMVYKNDEVSSCEYEVFKTYPFESSQQRMTVIGKERSKENYEIFIKGAPEKIASLCVKESGKILIISYISILTILNSNYKYLNYFSPGLEFAHIRFINYQ